MEFVHIVLFILLAIVFYLAWRLIRSPYWKQRQLKKASIMAARGDIDGMIIRAETLVYCDLNFSDWYGDFTGMIKFH